jgi:hypothetical protein
MSVDKTKLPPSKADAWCHIDHNTEDVNFSYAFSIGSFKSKIDSWANGKPLYSSRFKIEVGKRESEWKLGCYPNGKDELYSRNVGIYLFPVNKEAKSKHVSSTFELVKVDGSHTKKQIRIINFKDVASGTGCGRSKFISHEELNSNPDLLPGDCLQIYCKMIVKGPESEVVCSGTTSRPCSSFEMEEGPTSVIWMSDLLQSGEFADAEIVCDGTSFLCHKIVLASASPVFKAMLTNNMKEKETGKIVVEGIDKDTIPDMLNYIYGVKIDKMIEKAENLLAVAERYDLKQLKDYCEQLLVSSLKLENCVDYLMIADMHSANLLQSTVIKFMVDNARELEMQVDWQDTLVKFPKLHLQFSQELLLKHLGCDKNN